MRVLVIYKDETDYSRTVQDFLRDFKVRTSKELDVLDPDSSEGVQFCQTYDILQFPTIIAISDDGVMQNLWSGIPLPTISEVSYYVQ